MASWHPIYCGQCGHILPGQTSWPKKCSGCFRLTWINPRPAVVVLVPHLHGLIGERRAIDPGRGKLALPGGYVNAGQRWRDAAAAELWEELQLTIYREHVTLADDPDDILPADVLLIPCLSGPLMQPIEPFKPNEEVMERVFFTLSEKDEILYQDFNGTSPTGEATPTRLVFETHEALVRRYFKILRQQQKPKLWLVK